MSSTLPVVERFHSLQGEGAHSGRSAFFIRLASCNVQCSWCDTKNSWSKHVSQEESIIQLSEETIKARSEGASFVVITGGEPLHHNLEPLCDSIRKATATKNQMALPIHLETSGVDPLSGSPNWITLSPKRHAPPRIALIKACQELKVVIHDKEDLVFAEHIAKQTKKMKGPLLFLQPGWNNEQGLTLAFEYVKSNPQWRLSMQTHKWLKIR
ncbi:7-carboxy-7-deazaguanine synthase QueE [Prochlorococcus sp. MIT 1307]|uniref:7-carboxy-7-deazaguanine synthase QueE n=1 Tax=Prochlorococcus sp. MIT 1307 TaxID=3096219 RepID=UPI002A75419A|nr:7-carboxy-7-deazaguanine synthase QueE [Prochlorococcus sp. MIT 1307]